MLSRERIEIKTPDQVRLLRRAGLVVADIHAALREAVRPGVTTAELDAVSAAVIERAGAHSNFQGYQGYPATVCVSVNEEVVHGIPKTRVLTRPLMRARSLAGSPGPAHSKSMNRGDI